MPSTATRSKESQGAAAAHQKGTFTYLLAPERKERNSMAEVERESRGRDRAVTPKGGGGEQKGKKGTAQMAGVCYTRDR